MFGLGLPEIILILFVFLLFFGKDKLPELARSIGRSFNELKSGFSGDIKKSNSAEQDKEEEKKKS